MFERQTDRSVEDEAILELVRQARPEAFERLYAAYHARLQATAWAVLGRDDPDASDAVQEAFTQAVERLPRTKIHTNLYGWLNKVCVLRCFDVLRARQRQLASEHEELEVLSRPLSVEAERRKGEKVEKEERAEALRRAVASLAQPCRGLVTDRDLNGMSYVDLAKKYGIPLGTVMSRLSRCRQAVKKRLTSLRFKE